MRWLLVLAACGGNSGSVADGGNEVGYQLRKRDEGWYVELAIKLAKAGEQTSVKAACQLPDARLVDVPPPETGAEIKSSPFLLNPLRSKPVRCEITLRKTDGNMLAQFCIGDPTKPGACPPNALVPQTGPTGLRAELVSVKSEPADNMGFPEHLTVAYRVTAARDMVRGAYLVRTTTCPGHRSDATWHSELENLAKGESFDAAQNTYKLGRPAPGTKCETTFGYSPHVDGEVTPIATFCHVDAKITEGPCS